MITAKLEQFIKLKIEAKDIDPNVPEKYSLVAVDPESPYTVTKKDVIHMVEEYLNGKINFETMYEWVDNVRFNDDVFELEAMPDEQLALYLDILDFLENSDTDLFGFSTDTLKEKLDHLKAIS